MGLTIPARPKNGSNRYCKSNYWEYDLPAVSLTVSELMEINEQTKKQNESY
jgi:hypothetical protein